MVCMVCGDYRALSVERERTTIATRRPARPTSSRPLNARLLASRRSPPQAHQWYPARALAGPDATHVTARTRQCWRPHHKF